MNMSAASTRDFVSNDLTLGIGLPFLEKRQPGKQWGNYLPG
jgi:hypothetical protein